MIAELLNIAAIVFAPFVLAWAGWLGWNLGLASSGSPPSAPWRRLK